MRNKIKILFVFLLTASCTHEKINDNTQSEWGLINKIESEKWNEGKIISWLGAPNDIHENEKQNLKYLIYDYPKSNHQKWSFEISNKGELRNITFLPNNSNRKDFSSEKLISRWSRCVKKKSTDNSQHYIRYIYSLECGEKHKGYMNKIGEVTSISIEL